MHITGAGVGLRHPHLDFFACNTPPINWLEVHSENFFTQSKETYLLEQIRECYPLSMHGIGLSIGSAEPIDTLHLSSLKSAIQRYSPEFISEHLSWSGVNNHFTNDLLPLPYTEESFTCFSNKIRIVQDYLECKIFIENPSSYLQYKHSAMPEWEFFNNLANETQCGLLLDVNNVYVTCKNHDYDMHTYISALDATHIREIHVAGHARKTHNDNTIYIDDHGSKVSNEVWDLYVFTIEKFGVIPTLIEWDTNIPTPEILLNEADKAQKILDTISKTKTPELC